MFSGRLMNFFIRMAAGMKHYLLSSGPLTVKKRQAIRGNINHFHLSQFVFSNVDFFPFRESESEIGGEYPGGGNSLDDFPIRAQDGYVALSEYRDIKFSIRRKRHAIRALPAW